MNSVIITKPNGMKRIFHYVEMVEHKKSGLFVWQDSMSRPCTFVDSSEILSFKIVSQDE